MKKNYKFNTLEKLTNTLQGGKLAALLTSDQRVECIQNGFNPLVPKDVAAYFKGKKPVEGFKKLIITRNDLGESQYKEEELSEVESGKKGRLKVSKVPSTHAINLLTPEIPKDIKNELDEKLNPKPISKVDYSIGDLVQYLIENKQFETVEEILKALKKLK